MEIARLLTYDNNDGSKFDSDDGQQHKESPLVGAMPASLPQPTVRRRPPPRPPKPTLHAMRAQVVAYECILANLPHVLRDSNDPSALDDHETSGDSHRMRAFLLQSLALAKLTQKELAIRTVLMQLLKCHYKSKASLHKLLGGLALDDWHWTCERWRSLSLEYFTAFPDAYCHQLVQETLHAIKVYKLLVPESANETGLDFFGWRDSHRLDERQQHVHFTTRKTLWRSDIKECINRTWAMYEDSDRYKAYCFGANCQLFHQVVQRLSPDLMVFQTVEKFPSVPKMTHSLLLALRVETETGYLIAIRSIPSPRLQNFMLAEGLSLSQNFYWEAIDVVERNARGECAAIQITLAGSIGSDDCAYAKRWRDERVISLVRSEAKVLETPLLALESSPTDNGAATDRNRGL